MNVPNPRWYGAPGKTPEEVEKLEIENHIALWRRIRTRIKQQIEQDYGSLFAEEVFYTNEGLPLKTEAILNGEIDELLEPSIVKYKKILVAEESLGRIDTIIQSAIDTRDRREREKWQRPLTEEELQYQHGRTGNVVQPTKRMLNGR